MSGRVGAPAGLTLRCLTFAVFVLGVIQYIYGIVEHSSLLKMQFAASVLVFISSIEHIGLKRAKTETRTIFLLYRTAAVVFYIACLFLNLTHCLEEISDIRSKEDDTGHHRHGWSGVLLYISLADLIVKFTHTLLFNSLSINIHATLIAIVSPSLFTCLLFLYNFTDPQLLPNWLDHHLEPIFSILLTAVCIAIAVTSLLRKKQFLLAEGPKELSVEKIEDSVREKNGRLEKIDHVHASCEWPEGFSVSLKAYIKVEKTNSNWISRAACDFEELKALLHEQMTAESAKKVIVEPVFVDRSENVPEDPPVCIATSCHEEDVGCCNNRRLSSADESA